MKKNILITGCSSGLGFALAKLYLDKGYNVFGINRSKPNINHENFYFKEFDLSNTSLIKKELSAYLKELGSFEIVFLNAGMLGEVKILEDLNLNDMKDVYELNVYANKELLDILSSLEVKTILGTSSGAAVNGSKGWASYSLSKAGLNMLINLYSKEMLNTKLLAVAPGVIESPMTDYIRYELDEEVFTSAKILKDGKIQTPQEAAKRLEKLALRANEFESGSFIDIRNI